MNLSMFTVSHGVQTADRWSVDALFFLLCGLAVTCSSHINIIGGQTQAHSPHGNGDSPLAASSLPHSAGQCAPHTHNKNCLGVVYRTERKAVTLSLNSQDPSLIVNMHLNKHYPGPHAPHRTQMICCQFPGGTGTAGQLQRVPMRRWLNEWRQVEYLLYIWQEEHWFLNN